MRRRDHVGLVVPERTGQIRVLGGSDAEDRLVKDSDAAGSAAHEARS
ncbi:hypothetical protein TOK_3602 [Pseudonocardia sp. N23]|nr:hypothetical protein TOK_3602 [Pseudonocardia sp. N23]